MEYFSREVFKKAWYLINGLGCESKKNEEPSYFFLYFFTIHSLSTCQVCVICSRNTVRLTYKEVKYHGTDSGPIDVRSGAEQFHSRELSHHLWPGIAEWAAICEVRLQECFAQSFNLYHPFCLNLVLIFSGRAFLWIEIKYLEKALENADLLFGQIIH